MTHTAQSLMRSRTQASKSVTVSAISELIL